MATRMVKIEGSIKEPKILTKKQFEEEMAKREKNKKKKKNK